MRGRARRGFVGACALLVALGSCDSGPTYGCHDFGWNLSAETKAQPPWKYFWGFVQTRATGDGEPAPVYAICAMSIIQNIPYHEFEIEDGLIEAVRGRRVDVPRSKKAVYELQPDGSLKELALAPAEIEKALEVIDNRNDEYSGMEPQLTQPVFSEKIFPQLKQLKVIESPDPGRPPGEGFDPAFTPGFRIVEPSPAGKQAASPPD